MALNDAVIGALTTHFTAFFRDGHPFETLRSTLLPALIDKRRTHRQLNIWCAAASSGQEPYSVAMILHDLHSQLRGWNVRLIATDVCPQTLARARTGIYTEAEVSRGIPRNHRHHFSQYGAKLRLSDAIRERVEFRVLNLAQPWGSLPSFDLILLRNVLIYFSDETKRDILHRAGRQLRPDGRLLLGTTETTFSLAPEYQRSNVGRTSLYELRGRKAS